MHTCSLAVNQHFSFKVCCLSLRKVSLTHLHCGAPEAGALARRGPCSFQGQCGITGCFHFLRSYPSSKDFQSHVWCGFLTRPLPPISLQIDSDPHGEGKCSVVSCSSAFSGPERSQAECLYLPFQRSRGKVMPMGLESCVL